MRIEDRGPLGGTGALGPDAEKEREVRSKGTSGASGAVPDAVRPSYASMLEGLAAFAPTDLGTDFEARLAEIAQKMQDAKGEADMDRLSNEQETKRNQIQENRDRLDAAQGKMEGSGVADDAGRVSAIIGSVAAGLGAAAMMVRRGGRDSRAGASGARRGHVHRWHVYGCGGDQWPCRGGQRQWHGRGWQSSDRHRGGGRRGCGLGYGGVDHLGRGGRGLRRRRDCDLGGARGHLRLWGPC